MSVEILQTLDTLITPTCEMFGVREVSGEALCALELRFDLLYGNREVKKYQTAVFSRGKYKQTLLGSVAPP